MAFCKSVTLRTLITFFGLLTASNALACSFNCSKGEAYESENFEFEISDRIPLWKNHTAKPSGEPLLLTDLKKNEHPNCRLAIWYNSHKRPYDFSGIIKEYGVLAAPNYYNALGLKPFVRFDDRTMPDNPFQESIYKIHQACIDGGYGNACIDTIKVVEHFAKNKSMTDNYVKRAQGNNQDYWASINRILIPLTLAYSSAIQIEGKPDSHEMIGDWLLSAFHSNAYDPFVGKKEQRERDMYRETAGSCNTTKGNLNWGVSPAQNHSLSSAELAMMYGVLWNDTHMFQVGLDGFNLTLDTVNAAGALPCEAVRGGMALNYSGSTFSVLLNIYKIAEMQGHDLSQLYPEATKNLHRAAGFILRAVEDEQIIHGLAKSNRANDQCDTVKKQCFHSSGNRANAFGWTRLYRSLFPNHENTKKLAALKNEFVGKKISDPKRAKDLTALLISHYPTKDLMLNLVPHKSDQADLNQEYIDDLSMWAKGSPRCLYDTVSKSIEDTEPKSQTNDAFACVSTPFSALMAGNNSINNQDPPTCPE